MAPKPEFSQKVRNKRLYTPPLGGKTASVSPSQKKSFVDSASAKRWGIWATFEGLGGGGELVSGLYPGYIRVYLRFNVRVYVRVYVRVHVGKMYGNR